MTVERHASTTGAWRLVRGAVVGSSASGLGTLAHDSAGGGMASPVLFVGLGIVATSGCVLASRWRWSMPSLVAVLLATQFAFHLVFSAYDAVPTSAASGHVHHNPAVADHGTSAMTLTHAIVALIMAVLLRFGEEWLRRLLDVLALRAVRLAAAGLPLVPDTGGPVFAASEAAALSCGPITSHSGRGPPR